MQNYFHKIYNVYVSFSKLFRRRNESLNIFDLNLDFKNININSKFNESKSFIIDEEHDQVTILISFKNHKIEDIYYEIYYTNHIYNETL